ncbi:DeoR family transcriptional regulator [Lentzea albida]|uniref:Lactose phosphotransferase system repressor n=1 Tax=Lentzea albida TaxID=65499 RepID=A0A1H9RJ39_9PSEU|nr:DeoR family transcriptional regulator [Lentzea albida]SER72555.1 transcriptional regulator, DeoR family [Lentzea albida]
MAGRPPSDRVRRQGQLLEIVTRADFVGIADLSRRLRVSEVTIRSDLRDLEAAGHVRRVWGGAQPAAHAAVQDRRSPGATAVMAAALLRSHDAVFLGAGRLSADVAAALTQRPDLTGVTVVTGDLPACEQFADHLDRFTVRVTGGTLHGEVLTPAPEDVRHDRVDLAFVPCHRVDSHGVAHLDEGQLAAVARWSTVSSGRTVLLAAADVLAATGGTPWLTLGEEHTLITAPPQDRRALERLRATGVQLLAAAS